MKAKKTFCVRISIDAHTEYHTVNMELKSNILYFSDILHTEKVNEIKNINKFLKRNKLIKVEMITIYSEILDSNYRTEKVIDEYRYINHFEPKIAKAENGRFGFDSKEVTNKTIFQFIDEYSEILNNLMFTEYMKYISDIER